MKVLVLLFSASQTCVQVSMAAYNISKDQSVFKDLKSASEKFLQLMEVDGFRYAGKSWSEL